LIQRPNGSVIVGGASSKFRPLKEQWYNNTDDKTLIETTRDYYVNYMQRTFRGWENTGAEIRQIWTGIMGYSYDSLPHIGEVPAKENQFILAGFNGHGTPVTWLAAEELAKMVAREIKFEETEMPRLFKTTQFRIDRAVKGGEEGGDIIGDGSA
jgi:glycine/D-amino acid oxidase-like deaminating enzyme